MKLLRIPRIGVNRDHSARQITIEQDKSILLAPDSYHYEVIFEFSWNAFSTCEKCCCVSIGR